MRCSLRPMSRWVSLTSMVVAALLGIACGAGSSVGSVGAILSRDNDSRQLFVRDAPEDMAAAAAGLLPGDEIVMIDGLYVRDLSTTEVTRRLRGEIGTTVELTVVRGGEVLQVDVTRTAMRASKEVAPPVETLEE